MGRARTTVPEAPTSDILPDVLQTGLRLVICGSAAGRVSAERRAYYAHPQNRFWSILAETGLTPHKFEPDEFPSLPEYGIGLTDVTKIEFGSDTDLTTSDEVRLRTAIARCQPGALAFNGKRAASLALGRPTGSIAYGEQHETLATIPVFVCPSTSPLAVRWWNTAPWHALAERVQATA